MISREAGGGYRVIQAGNQLVAGGARSDGAGAVAQEGDGTVAEVGHVAERKIP